MTRVSGSLLIIVIAAFAILMNVDLMAADAEKPVVAAVPAKAAEPNFATMNPDEVLAKFGSEKLTLKEIKYFIPTPTAESAKQLAQQWIDLQMLYDAAQKRGIINDPKTKLLAELDSKQLFARELMNKIAEEVNIPDANVLAYYEKNKNTDPQLSEPTRLSFTHVRTKTLEDANKVKKRIEAGLDIGTAAKESSFAEDAMNGGAVKKMAQTMVERQYSKEFADALLASSEGKLIGPIPVKDGFFELARHEGKLSSKAYPFEMVKDTIKRNLEQTAKTSATQKFMENLKTSSQPKIYVSPLLETPAPKVQEAKSAKDSNLPVDKTKTKTDNSMQKK